MYIRPRVITGRLINTTDETINIKNCYSMRQREGEREGRRLREHDKHDQRKGQEKRRIEKEDKKYTKKMKERKGEKKGEREREREKPLKSKDLSFFLSCLSQKLVQLSQHALPAKD